MLFSRSALLCFAKLYGSQHSGGGYILLSCSHVKIFVRAQTPAACRVGWGCKFSCGKQFRGQGQENHCICFVSPEIFTIFFRSNVSSVLISVPSSSQTFGTEKYFWVMKSTATKISLIHMLHLQNAKNKIIICLVFLPDVSILGVKYSRVVIGLCV